MVLSKEEAQALVAFGRAGNSLTEDQKQALREYKAVAMTGQQDPQKALQAVADISSRELTAQDKLFKQALGKIAPIKDVVITETGETPFLRLVHKIYGPDGWTFDDNMQVIVKPKGAKEFMPLPAEGLGSTLGRMGQSIVGGVGGELVGAGVGSLAGPVGIPVGAAIGGFAGGFAAGSKNVADAVNAGKKIGIIKPEEQTKLNQVILTSGAVEGGLNAALGAGVPLIKGAKAMISNLPKKLSEIPGAVESFKQGVRTAKTPAQAAINLLDRTGSGSNEILESLGLSPGFSDLQKQKAAVLAENTSRRMMADFGDVSAGDFGSVVKKSADKYLERVNKLSNAAFNNADASVMNQLRNGKPVQTLDVSDVMTALKRELYKDKTPAQIAEADKFISALEETLNLTKRDIASGRLKVPERTKAMFSKQVSVKDPDTVEAISSLDAALGGKPKITPGKEKTVTQLDESFDPVAVTARDFKVTKTFLKDTLTKLENPRFVLDKRDKKTITQWLKAFESPFTKEADEASEIALDVLDNVATTSDNPFLEVAPKIVGGKGSGAKPFEDITKGYKIRTIGFDKLPLSTRKILKAPNAAALEDSLLNTDVSTIKGLKKIVDRTASETEKAQYAKAVKARTFNPPTTAGKKQLSPTTARATPDSLLQASALGIDDMKTLQAQGIKLNPNPVKDVQLTKSQQAQLPAETMIQGNYAANVLSGSENPLQALLGQDEATRLLFEAQELAKQQRMMGIPQSAVDIGDAGNKGIGGNFKLSDLLKTIPVVARPATRVAGNTLEAARDISLLLGGAGSAKELAGFGIRTNPIGELLTSPEQRRR